MLELPLAIHRPRTHLAGKHCCHCQLRHYPKAAASILPSERVPGRSTHSWWHVFSQLPRVNTLVLLGDCKDKVAKCHCCVACVGLGLYLCCWMLAKRARKEASPVTLVAAVQSRSLTWRSLLPVEFAIGIVAVLAVAVANHLPEDCAREKLLGKLGGAVAVSLATVWREIQGCRRFRQLALCLKRGIAKV